VDERRDSSAATPAAAVVVSSADADEEDRRATRSLVIALLLALLVAAAVGLTNADGLPDSTVTGSNGSTGSTAGGAPSGACRISDEAAAVLSAAKTPWDYMRILGYPKSTVGVVLNERAESVMDEHANGQVRWDPAATDGVYSDDAQLVLIMGEDGQTVEITETQQVMELLGMEAVCPAGTSEAVLPAVS
jgi:hypothetical protein